MKHITALDESDVPDRVDTGLGFRVTSGQFRNTISLRAPAGAPLPTPRRYIAQWKQPVELEGILPFSSLVKGIRS